MNFLDVVFSQWYVSWRLETTFFGGEEVGRCSTLVALGIFGGYYTFLQTK
jgi:hypothetical protein